MSKSVYVHVFHDLELLRYNVHRCVIERQLYFPAGMNQVYCYCYCYLRAFVVFVEGIAKPWLVPEVKQVLHSSTFILPSRQRMQKPAKQNHTGVVLAQATT